MTLSPLIWAKCLLLKVATSLPRSKAVVKARPNDRFEIAAITVAELWHGVEQATGTHKVTRQRYLDAILNTLISFRVSHFR
jgi:hypothetical protein